MPKRTRILVVDNDLHLLSRIYLSLIHKDYKVEATNDAEEIMTRTERFRPRLVIIRAGTKNLSEGMIRELSQKRIHVLLITEEEFLPRLKRLERISMPADINVFDMKIREMLNIFE